MAAQLTVRTVESDEGERCWVNPGHVLGTRAEGTSFLALPYDEAIAYFGERKIITPEEFAKLQDRFKRGGFSAVKLAGEALTGRARDAIQAALTSGQTIDETIAQIREGELALGIDPVHHDYLDNVVRTNLATAYGQGRLDAMTSESVLAARPYWMSLSAGDNRVRENHRALHGRVFRAASDEAIHYCKPLGYRCRCTDVTLSEAQLLARGLVVTEGRIAGIEPDEGWSGRPVFG